MLDVVLVTHDYGVYGWSVYRDSAGAQKETRLAWYGGENGDDRDAETERVYVARKEPRTPLIMLDGDEWRALEGWGDLDAFYGALLDGKATEAHDVLRAALHEADGPLDDDVAL